MGSLRPWCPHSQQRLHAVRHRLAALRLGNACLEILLAPTGAKPHISPAPHQYFVHAAVGGVPQHNTGMATRRDNTMLPHEFVYLLCVQYMVLQGTPTQCMVLPIGCCSVSAMFFDCSAGQKKPYVCSSPSVNDTTHWAAEPLGHQGCLRFINKCGHVFPALLMVNTQPCHRGLGNVWPTWGLPSPSAHSPLWPCTLRYGVWGPTSFRWRCGLRSLGLGLRRLTSSLLILRALISIGTGSAASG